jgi:hypothetical protein
MKFTLKSYACPAPSDITAMLSPSFHSIHPLLEIPANIQPQIFPSSSKILGDFEHIWQFS